MASSSSSSAGAGPGAAAVRDGEGHRTTRRDTTQFERERGVTEIRTERAITHLSVRLPAERLAAEQLALLQSLAAENVPLFLVKLLPYGISFAIRGESARRCEALLDERGVVYASLPDLAVVSTIAGAMRDLSGVMAAIYEALLEAGVRVRQTGDAYNAVHCLVDAALAEQASAALERRFGLGADAVAAAAEASAPQAAPAAAASGGLKAL